MNETVSEIISNDLVPVVLKFIGALLGVLVSIMGVIVIPYIKKWTATAKASLETKLGKENAEELWYNVRWFIQEAVRAAEQKFGDGQGALKKSFVIDAVTSACNKLGISVPTEYIEIVLESACAEFFPHTDSNKKDVVTSEKAVAGEE